MYGNKKHNFMKYYAQLSKEDGVHQLHRLQGCNQHGGHNNHMNLNRVNMHDNADYDRNCGDKVLFGVIATPRIRTVNTMAVASSSMECIVASQYGVACYQPSFAVRSNNTDAGITVRCVNRAILNISIDKSHPFHEHFKSLDAKKISELTKNHNDNNLSNSTNLNILISNQENEMLSKHIFIKCTVEYEFTSDSDDEALVIIRICHFSCYHVAFYLFLFFGFCG